MRRKLLFLMALLVSSTMAWADASGSCGDDVTWSYVESSHTLTISGTGEMTNYSVSSKAPWDTYRSQIESVVIESGVTSIGGDAFNGCTGLTSITIPSSGVTSIGDFAFNGCTGLTSIDIPSSVTSIGNGAFDGTGLTTVTIPNNVTSIGYNAFSSCSNLTSITIGRGVTSIGNLAFMSSPIATITLANGLTSIGDSWFKQCNSLTTVNIPNSVTSIGNQAFYSTGLTSVDIPSSVTSIGDEAFWNCSIPTVICWATTAPTLGNKAFSSYPHFYVPSVDAYKDETNWHDYYTKNLLLPISEKSPAATMPEATRSITAGVYEGSWTTFYYSGANMQAPEGVTVYKATLSGDELTLVEISDRIITAGQAVILKKTEGDIVLSVAASASSDDYTGNALLGVDAETAQSGEFGGTNYVLSMVGDDFGFYKLASSKKLSANKAYLPGSSISGAREFVGFGFSEGATKIDHVSVKTNEVDGTVYDLQGRRVSQPTKGLYIVNGKKVVIK